MPDGSIPGGQRRAEAASLADENAHSGRSAVRILSTQPTKQQRISQTVAIELGDYQVTFRANRDCSSERCSGGPAHDGTGGQSGCELQTTLAAAAVSFNAGGQTRRVLLQTPNTGDWPPSADAWSMTTLVEVIMSVISPSPAWGLCRRRGITGRAYHRAQLRVAHATLGIGDRSRASSAPTRPASSTGCAR